MVIFVILSWFQNRDTFQRGKKELAFGFGSQPKQKNPHSSSVQLTTEGICLKLCNYFKL